MHRRVLCEVVKSWGELMHEFNLFRAVGVTLQVASCANRIERPVSPINVLVLRGTPLRKVAGSAYRVSSLEIDLRQWCR